MTATAAPSDDLGAAALDVARHGVRCVPLFYGERFPTLKRWPELATTEPERLARLFDDARVTGVAAVLGIESGAWVLDVDPTGFDTLAALEFAHGRLPTTAVVKSRRGIHLWFRWPCGVSRIPTIAPAPRLGPGLDVKATSGACALPPTPHSEGAYSWLRGLDELTDAPDWLVSRVVELPRSPCTRMPLIARIGDAGRYGAAALAREAERVAVSVEGARHATTISAACSIGRLVAGGEIDEGDAELRLVEAALCSGLPEREARRTVTDGLRKGMQSPRRRPNR